MLALARRFAASKPERALRFVAFPGEEPPHFGTDAMGSAAYARGLRSARAGGSRGDEVAAMLSLETLGCYSDAPGSQRYPIPLLRLAYPDRGDFVTFVGNLGSGALVRRAIGAFRERAAFPSEGAALPSWIPGVGWSDHAAFWDQGIPRSWSRTRRRSAIPHYHHRDGHAGPRRLRAARARRRRLVAVVERLSRATAAIPVRRNF
jgi:Zn-dependent M28 family amino/carboxypeptidase